MSEIARESSPGGKDRALNSRSGPEQATTPDLRLLSTDASLSKALTQKGYSSIAAIANAPYDTFSRAVGEAASPQEIERIYASAQAQHGVMNTIAAGLLADQSWKELAYTDGLPAYQAEP